MGAAKATSAPQKEAGWTQGALGPGQGLQLWGPPKGGHPNERGPKRAQKQRKDHYWTVPNLPLRTAKALGELNLDPRSPALAQKEAHRGSVSLPSPLLASLSLGFLLYEMQILTNNSNLIDV